VLQICLAVKIFSFNVGNAVGVARLHQYDISWEVLILCDLHDFSHSQVLPRVHHECGGLAVEAEHLSGVFHVISTMSLQVFEYIFDRRYSDDEHQRQKNGRLAICDGDLRYCLFLEQAN